MKRLSLILVIGSLYCAELLAAPADEHIRGKIISITRSTLVVRTSSDVDVSIALNGGTQYLKVVPSSLDQIESGSYIGTATKDIGSAQVALEVMIFPPAMQGLNAGHFPYDPLPDTTISGATTTTSMMTNGNVSVVSAPPVGDVSTTMTNGNISTAIADNGVKQLTVTYKGGQQTVVVPATAPIVNLVPATVSDLSKGAYVFVDAAKDGSYLTAGLVAAGVGGLKPPF